MADRVADITSFIGGEADSIYKGPANSFYQGENIEVRKNLDGFQLSPMLEDIGWTYDDTISYMIDLDSIGVSSGGIIVCLENGKIYLNNVLKQTINTGTNPHNRIIGIGVNKNTSGNLYVYFISKTSLGSGKIHRATTNLNTWNISYRDFVTSSLPSTKCTVINTTGLLYIFINDRVFLMEDIEIVTEYLAIGQNEEIKFAYEYGGRYRIYANNGDTGVEYTWDGFALAPFGRQEFKSKPFIGGTSEGAFAYIVVGFNENYASLLRFPGSPYEEIRVNLEGSPDSRIFDGYLSVRDSIVYISGGKTGQSDNYGIYTYGNYYPGTSKSLVQSYSGTTNRFTWHAHTGLYSYFATIDDKVLRINHNNPSPIYATEGYIDSLVYQGGVWEDMFLKVVKFAHLNTTGSIEIYARTSFGASDIFKLITTINSGQLRKTIVYKSEIVEEAIAEFGNFTEIQFRIKLIRGVSTATPVFRRLTALLTLNENNNGNG